MSRVNMQGEIVNTKFLHNDITCPCCEMVEDTMSHQLECITLSHGNMLVDQTMTFNDIYSDSVNKQAQITHIFDQAIRRRKIYLKHIQKFTQ